MSITLPELPSRYPDLGSWLDLSGLLINGWEPAGDDACGVAVTPNVAIFNMRIRGDGATAWQLMQGIPLDLYRSVQYLAAVAPRGATVAQIYSLGRVQIPGEAQGHFDGGLSAADWPGVWTITGAIPRRPGR